LIYILDLEGIFTYISPNWEKVLGYVEEEVIGRKFEVFVHAEDVKKCWGYFNSVINDEISEQEVENRVLHKDGHIVWNASILSPFRNESGEIIYYIGIARETTYRKFIEIQIEKYAEDLKISNETKDKFFSILAHDLRSPFHVLLNLSELLADDIETLSNDEIKYFSAELHNALQKQFELLSDLLEWSIVQSEGLGIDIVEFSLNDAVMNVYDTFNMIAQKKEITLSNNINPDLIIYSDKDMIRLVLRNLISNGIKFSNKGGRILVDATNNCEDVLISVIDNGIGISEVAMKNIFRNDLRYTTSGTSNEKGTGLGLNLCRDIVKKLGGKISVESKPGVETKFSFTLPMHNQTK
jgi:PAS domain S-box-containing protein